MAGFPMRRALERKIEELGGIEFVTAHISQGMTIGRLAEFIECSRPMLSFWINHTDERRDAVLAARMDDFYSKKTDPESPTIPVKEFALSHCFSKT